MLNFITVVAQFMLYADFFEVEIRTTKQTPDWNIPLVNRVGPVEKHGMKGRIWIKKGHPQKEKQRFTSLLNTL